MQDVLKLFRQDFSHEAQARMCARQLASLRTDLADNWWRYPKQEVKRSARRGSADWAEGPWSREQVNLAGYLIRLATESVDFPATVDFITRDTAACIKASQAASARRTIGHLTQWDQLTHEHMVPGKAILRLITDPEIAGSQTDLEPLLAALSLRALVSGTKRKRAEGYVAREIEQIDAHWESRLAQPAEIKGWNGPMALKDVPPRYYGLMRYEAAGLLDQLIPVQARARTILAEYLAYRAGT